MAATLEAHARPSSHLPPAPEPARRNLMRVATILVVAAGIMLFGGLIGSYLTTRSVADAWLPEDVLLPNVPLAMAYLTLAMSSVTAQWAVAAIRVDARNQLYLALLLTVGLGLAFVNALWFSLDSMGVAAGDGGFGTSMYAVVITHLVAVIAAHVLFLVMGFRALGGQFSARNDEFVDAAATFWHFTTLVGLVVYFTVWFLEGAPG